MKLLAANAEYRALRRTGGPWQSVVGRLDAIAKRYADVLRDQPDNEDAAYNYEFVLRLRAARADGSTAARAGRLGGRRAHRARRAPARRPRTATRRSSR